MYVPDGQARKPAGSPGLLVPRAGPRCGQATGLPWPGLSLPPQPLGSPSPDPPRRSPPSQRSPREPPDPVLLHKFCPSLAATLPASQGHKEWDKTATTSSSQPSTPHPPLLLHHPCPLCFSHAGLPAFPQTHQPCSGLWAFTYTVPPILKCLSPRKPWNRPGSPRRMETAWV